MTICTFWNENDSLKIMLLNFTDEGFECYANNSVYFVPSCDKCGILHYIVWENETRNLKFYNLENQYFSFYNANHKMIRINLTFQLANPDSLLCRGQWMVKILIFEISAVWNSLRIYCEILFEIFNFFWFSVVFLIHYVIRFMI